MHDIELIKTLTGGLLAALFLGYVTQRLRLSPIVGYLLAGIAVGPYSPGFEADRAMAEQLAEVGVILLMFGVGLQFHLKELLAVRRIAIPGAVGQSIVATVLGTAAGCWMGWDYMSGIVFGLAISVASTVVLIRVLVDNNDLHTRTGHIAVGWLVVEDLFTVIVLVILPALATKGGQAPSGESSLVLEMGFALIKISALVAIVFLVGGRVIPWLLDRVAATRSRELFTLTTLVVALGIAVGSAELFGVSMALGAFLAGMIVGRSDFSNRAAAEALPMRDAFAVLFFVSIGMLFDPRFLVESPGITAVTLAIILVGKPLTAFLIVFWMRYPLRTALAVAVALGQIGEFSFILATLGSHLKIFNEEANNAIIGAAIISISINPLLYRMVDPLEKLAQRHPRLWAILNIRRQQSSLKTGADADARGPHAKPGDRDHRAVVIGYGPVGQTVSRLLLENDIEPTVIELNLETSRRLRDQGIPSVYGDATHVDTLKAAGVEMAGSLILSAPGMAAKDIIRQARELNPDIRILARSSYLTQLPTLREAGAQAVFSDEVEVSLAFTETILRDLGATPEQIERERARIHDDIARQKASSH